MAGSPEASGVQATAGTGTGAQARAQAGDEPGIGAAALAGREAQGRDSDPGALDSHCGPPGAASPGPKVSSAASRALTGFRGQGHAVGRRGRPAVWSAGGGAGQGAQQAPQKGCPALPPARRARARPHPTAGAGREPAVRPAPGAGAGGPRARCCGAPARSSRAAGREEKGRFRRGESRGSRTAPAGDLPGRGAEEGRGASGRGARAEPPPRRSVLSAAHPPGRAAAT